MDFETKQIGVTSKQSTLNLEERKERKIGFGRKIKKFGKWHYIVLLPIFAVCVSLVFYVIFSVYAYSSDKSFMEKIFKPVMSSIERDENGFVNILLVGQGGRGHDGPELTDTMIVASIDFEKKNIVMLSVPRDFWVDTKQFGGSRINEVYRNVKNYLETRFNTSEDIAREEAMRLLISELENVVDIQIPYYARIDFDGFMQVINRLEGIEVEVEKDIYDETYPDGNWGYELFELKQGIQTLDGETALKYSRSRHDSSDFDRAKRQQNVIQAVKDKALSLGVLTSPRKITQLYKVVNEHFYSNFTLKELLSLAVMGAQFDRADLSNSVLNDDWNSKGGFLGTPPRADYGGAYVLIPYSGFENFERIHIFTKFLFQFRDIQFSKFEVLNGTTRSGLATRAAQRLERYGFSISSVGNTSNKESYKESELWIYDAESSILNALPFVQEIFSVKVVNKVGYYEEADVAATFVIGEDYK
ncbi:LCP family protein [Candidatus Peregrinibacteria bacterium]|jgi:LCP family protein required for cell wall assembly|nr:LCP family protein [Candidatus Peregrinibacteria bacterium]